MKRKWILYNMIGFTIYLYNFISYHMVIDFIGISLETFKIRNIDMHCFTGNFKMVKRVQDNGWTFSIPTNITRLFHFQKIVEETSISQLLTETDSPYLSPFKEERNEPSFVVESVKKISEIKKLDEEETKKLIYMNFQKFFIKK